MSRLSEHVRTIIVNAGEIAHMSHGDTNMPLLGHEMGDKSANVHEPGLGILIESGNICRIDDSREISDEFVPSWKEGSGISDGTRIIDVAGKAIVPGFVDSHSHLLWGGDRSNEIALRQSGMTYSEISGSGGGIGKTVRETRKLSLDELISIGKDRVSRAISHGTTTMEVKSGYGLSVDSELKLLEAAGRIADISPIDIHPTWLGAHDVPKGMNKDDYVEELISEQLPKVASQGISKWADVFCEPGWFDLVETEDIIKAANEYGLQSRLHVDEFVDSDGLSLAADLGSVSADHVAHSNHEARNLASKSGTMQTFLPGTPYVMGTKEYPPIADCIENRWAFSLASDFNPNCNSLSIPFVGSLAAHRCDIDPISALSAVTRNPSTTLGYGGSNPVGTLSNGSHANLNILISETVDLWCQTPGMNPISATVVRGIL